MPTWLGPWLVPLALLASVVAVAISKWLGIAVVVICASTLLPYLRLQHLKRHPPDPELRSRKFWEF
jgi:formate hydrogenlyase subunit 4